MAKKVGDSLKQTNAISNSLSLHIKRDNAEPTHILYTFRGAGEVEQCFAGNDNISMVDMGGGNCLKH